MRIIGFSKSWEKLEKQEFTTFRFTRRDRDWKVGEQVQVVIRPRSRQREVLGVAQIVKKERRGFDRSPPEGCVARSEMEARADGFRDRADMLNWLEGTHGQRVYEEGMNKLTLNWIQKVPIKLDKCHK